MQDDTADTWDKVIKAKGLTVQDAESLTDKDRNLLRADHEDPDLDSMSRGQLVSEVERLQAHRDRLIGARSYDKEILDNGLGVLSEVCRAIDLDACVDFSKIVPREWRHVRDAMIRRLSSAAKPDAASDDLKKEQDRVRSLEWSIWRAALHGSASVTVRNVADDKLDWSEIRISSTSGSSNAARRCAEKNVELRENFYAEGRSALTQCMKNEAVLAVSSAMVNFVPQMKTTVDVLVNALGNSDLADRHRAWGAICELGRSSTGAFGLGWRDSSLRKALECMRSGQYYAARRHALDSSEAFDDAPFESADSSPDAGEDVTCVDFAGEGERDSTVATMFKLTRSGRQLLVSYAIKADDVMAIMGSSEAGRIKVKEGLSSGKVEKFIELIELCCTGAPSECSRSDFDPYPDAWKRAAWEVMDLRDRLRDANGLASIVNREVTRLPPELMAVRDYWMTSKNKFIPLTVPRVELIKLREKTCIANDEHMDSFLSEFESIVSGASHEGAVSYPLRWGLALSKLREIIDARS
ncbi:MAG: hypothetical protein ACPG77_04140 [Nannocystaceae bacterium]